MEEVDVFFFEWHSITGDHGLNDVKQFSGTVEPVFLVYQGQKAFIYVLPQHLTARTHLKEK